MEIDPKDITKGVALGVIGLGIFIWFVNGSSTPAPSASSTPASASNTGPSSSPDDSPTFAEEDNAATAISQASMKLSPYYGPNSVTADQERDYLAKRMTYIVDIEDFYFAAGCKVITSGEVNALANAQYPWIKADAMADGIVDFSILDVGQSAARDGNAMAEEAGNCAYWASHPNAVDLVKSGALGALRSLSTSPPDFPQ